MKGAATQWTILRPNRITSLGHATLKFLEDGSILATGKNPEADTYVVEAQANLGPITGLRLEVLNDVTLPNGGPGRDPEGNFFLSDVELEVSPPRGGKLPRRSSLRKRSQTSLNLDTTSLISSRSSRGRRPGQSINRQGSDTRSAKPCFYLNSPLASTVGLSCRFV